MVHLCSSSGAHGRLTEWLGSGLQNRVRRFDSATDLNKSPEHEVQGLFCFHPKPACRVEGENKKDPNAAKRHRAFVEGFPIPDGDPATF